MVSHGFFRATRRPKCHICRSRRHPWQSFSFASKWFLKLTIGCILVVVASSSSSSAASVSTPSGFWKDWDVWSIFRINNGPTKENVDENITATADSNRNQTLLNRTTAKGSHNIDDGNDINDEDVFSATADSSFWNTSPLMTKKRTQFLDRIAVIASSLMKKEASMLDQLAEDATFIDLDAVTPQSDLTMPGRHIHIVTTAALPWFTGTAVNPLLRAAYLHRKTQEINQNYTHKQYPRRWVTLIIPWLELPEDQKLLYHGRIFASAYEQERYIRDWLIQEADMPDAACEHTGLEILFYPGRYHTGLGSIFAMGDIIDTIVDSSSSTSNITMQFNSNNNTNGSNETMVSSLIATSEPRQLDVCILEEPEHCNWYRAPGDGWTKRFNYVVGIVHTNYKEYASSHYSGLWTAPAIALMSSAMIRAYCHKVIKLSNTLQSYAVEKESTSNVHGVRSNFWQEGLRRSKQKSAWKDDTKNSTQVYFIGKLLWAKGLDLMLELEDYYKQYTGDYFAIDVYGNGPDQRAITRAFHGRRNSVNANPKEEAAIEALDNDKEGNENGEWNGSTMNGKNPNSLQRDELDDVFWSSIGVDFYEKAKQKISKLQESINTALDIHEVTKEHIAKIKDAINSVEIPTTFAELRRQPIPATFPGRVDHGSLTDYRIFLNPSISEVLCTTTAEALAMGKYAIIPVHPSNTFFLQFPNCLAYRNKFEFVANLRWALTHDPEPLTEEQAHQFTWEAATERLITASAITWREALERERLGLAKLDERIAWFHNELGKGTTGDFLRKVLGAGPASDQVKYQKEKNGDASYSPGDDEKSDNPLLEDDEEETGFSRKFRRSSFAQAISAAVKDFSSFGIIQ